jgi:hypothetical protein
MGIRHPVIKAPARRQRVIRQSAVQRSGRAPPKAARDRTQNRLPLLLIARGEAMAGGPGLYPVDAAGQCGSNSVPGKTGQSAPVVVAVMTMVDVVPVVVMMTPPAGVGIQHLRAERCSRDDGRVRRLARCAGTRRERGRGKNENGEQACENRLEHFFSS